MKYINKFIGTGLGFALIFTGTNFAQAMFTSSARQENIITIPKKSIVVDTYKQGFFTKKITGRFRELYIPINITGDISINDLDIKATLTGGVNNFNFEIIKSNTNYLVISTKSGEYFDTSENLQLSLSIGIKNTEHLILDEDYLIIKNNNGNPGGEKQLVDIQLIEKNSQLEINIEEIEEKNESLEGNKDEIEESGGILHESNKDEVEKSEGLLQEDDKEKLEGNKE